MEKEKCLDGKAETGMHGRGLCALMAPDQPSDEQRLIETSVSTTE